MAEQFSFDYRKTKTKVIYHANQSQRTQTIQSTNQICAAGAKRGKTYANESQMAWVF